MAQKQSNEIPEELQCLKRIEDLLQVIARAALSTTVREQLSDKKQRVLYELTGKLPIKTLSQKTGFAVGKISGIWQKWEESGLLIKDGKQYRKVV